MEQTTHSPYEINELKLASLTFLIVLTMLKIIFYNQDLITLSKITAAIFWLFILPGYFLSTMWKKDLPLTERIIISIPISTAILGILSYYLGLAGLDLKLQSIILPTLLIFAAIIINKKIIKKTGSTQNI